MKSYRELQVFQESRQLAIEIHKMTMQLPRYELYEEGSQIRRSSKSITALIVEGYGRRKYKAEFVRYLIQAHAECDETITHLEFLHQTGSLVNIEVYGKLQEGYSKLSKKLNGFIQWVNTHWNDFTPVEKPEI